MSTQLQAVRLVQGILAGRSLTALFEQKTAGQKLTPAQTGALRDLAYGTLRHLGFLQQVSGILCTKPVADRDVETLLWVALYQLEFTRTPPHAVVNEAVNGCSQLRKTSAKSLVNAVLRSYLRRRLEVGEEARRNDVGRWSHPQWWIDRLRSSYPNRFRDILDAGNGRAPMTLRVNARRSNPDAYLEHLSRKGLAAEPVSETALRLDAPVAVDELPGFRDGLVSVQDLGAQYAAPSLDVRAGQRVLDACAAPGGKTAHILEGSEAEVVALDNDAARLTRVEQNLNRLGLQARLMNADAGDPATWWDGRPFDRILLDVPCSASGVVRRHPDIKWLRRPEDIAGFSVQQSRLLKAVWPTLTPGGKLLYATCSVFPEENQMQVSAFLQTHPDATQLKLAGVPDDPEIGVITGQILPNSRHDGFFYALLHKT